jgi:hypothetical protein
MAIKNLLQAEFLQVVPVSLLQPKDTIYCRAHDTIKYESGQSYISCILSLLRVVPTWYVTASVLSIDLRIHHIPSLSNYEDCQFLHQGVQYYHHKFDNEWCKFLLSKEPHQDRAHHCQVRAFKVTTPF